MKIKYICTQWGQEDKTATEFVEKVIAEGYNGIEVNIGGLADLNNWRIVLERTRLKQPDFVVVAQMVLDESFSRFTEFSREMEKRLHLIAPFQPAFINAHTGKDYFSFDDNCRLIEQAFAFSEKTGIKVYHETHRGHFSFALHEMQRYLQQFPGLELVADYSHWCNVSESMLQQQEENLTMITPHVKHIHARVGFEHGPQLANPFASPYKKHLEVFTQWWRQILNFHTAGNSSFTICPEAGPVPYMPVHPDSNEPLADQWKINITMLEYLKKVFPAAG